MKEAFNELRSDIEQLRQEQRRKSLLAGNSLLAEMIERIFERGKDATGRDNLGGEYSKKPYFALINKFVNKQRIPSDKVSKSGKSVQLPEGYTSFRKYSGRQTEVVDFDYTGVLRNSIVLNPTEKGFQIGIIGGRGSKETGATPIDKSHYLESMNKGKVFYPSVQEVENFLKLI